MSNARFRGTEKPKRKVTGYTHLVDPRSRKESKPEPKPEQPKRARTEWGTISHIIKRMEGRE